MPLSNETTVAADTSAGLMAMVTSTPSNPTIPRHHIYFLPVVILVGIVGNLLSVAVMLRRRFRSLSSSVYLLALALVDCVCLLLDLKLKDWLVHLGLPSHKDNANTCRIYWWLTQSVPFISSWIVVAVTVERAIIVCRPLKAKLICTRLKTMIVVALLVVFFLLSATYVFAVVEPHGCHIPSRLKLPIAFTAIAVYSILPFIIILVCNLTIVAKLIQQRRFMAIKMAATSAQAQTDTQRLTGMLIANSIVFIVLTLPFNVLVAYRIVSRDTSSYRMASTITTYMVTLNHSINFFLYVICGSLYRQELFLMFCPKRVQANGRDSMLQNWENIDCGWE